MHSDISVDLGLSCKLIKQPGTESLGFFCLFFRAWSFILYVPNPSMIVTSWEIWRRRSWIREGVPNAADRKKNTNANLDYFRFVSVSVNDRNQSGFVWK